MSISSEITRIRTKRDLAFTAIENKGVTVPSGSDIQDLELLISKIPSFYDDIDYWIDEQGHLILTSSYFPES